MQRAEKRQTIVIQRSLAGSSGRFIHKVVLLPSARTSEAGLLSQISDMLMGMYVLSYYRPCPITHGNQCPLLDTTGSVLGWFDKWIAIVALVVLLLSSWGSELGSRVGLR